MFPVVSLTLHGGCGDGVEGSGGGGCGCCCGGGGVGCGCERGGKV